MQKETKNALKALKYQQKNASKVIKARRLNKLELIRYKGGKCEQCGYNKPYVSVYHFHHINPEEKDFTVSKHINRSLNSLKKEVDKCQLLCSNCHHELHDTLTVQQLDKSIELLSSLSIDQLKQRAERRQKERKRQFCTYCCNQYFVNFKTQKFCTKECYFAFRKELSKKSDNSIKS